MTPALLSLGALVLAVVLSCTSRVNVGLLAFALAWLIGVYASGMKADVVAAGFPVTLFVTLTGVTLLFGAAGSNGTLLQLADRAVRLCRGNAALLPPFFFLLAMLVSTVGPGGIASTALLAPLALATAARLGISLFLTAVMVGLGANAGNLSPISAVGVIVANLMERIGLPGHEWKVWAANGIAHALVAVAAYALLRGWRRPAARPEPARGPLRAPPGDRDAGASLDWRQRLTLAVTAAWVVGVVLLGIHTGFGAFAAATALILAGAVDERDAVRAVPWGVILMVCGVTTLIGLLERTGGLDLFTRLLARLATPGSLNGVIAFVTGLVSTYSSTSGVVLPAFLPTVPGLVRQVGGGDPLAVALSINVGSSLVDVSPLSTIGALCVAAVPDQDESRGLFRQLLLWGLSMTVVGALICQLLAGALARA